jgi:hypothetical protein
LLYLLFAIGWEMGGVGSIAVKFKNLVVKLPRVRYNCSAIEWMASCSGVFNLREGLL